MEVADRIVVMDRGRVVQQGSVDAVYENPASPFVFEFLGNANVLPVEVRGRQVFLPGSTSPLVTDSIHEHGRATCAWGSPISRVSRWSSTRCFARGRWCTPRHASSRPARTSRSRSRTCTTTRAR